MLRRHPRQNQKYKLAVIDFGTNSIRLDIFEISKDKKKRIYRERHMLRFGDQVFVKRKLGAPLIQKTTKLICEFHQMSQRIGVKKIVAFGTSALREAQDREAILKAVYKKCGLKLKVISGDTEAALIAKGILKHEYLSPGVFALVDIGGGSTEISLCEGQNAIWSKSFKLGTSRIKHTFLNQTPPKTHKGVDPVLALRKHIRKTLNPLLKQKKKKKIFAVLGSSGTVRALQKIMKKNKLPSEPFKKEHLKALSEWMAVMNQNEIMQIEGVEPQRVDMILGGAILLDEISNLLGVKRVFLSEYSLRDGILEEILDRKIN